MIGYHRTNRGTYKCDYCDRKGYKGEQGAANHVERLHPTEFAVAKAEAEAADKIREANNAKWIAERRANDAAANAARLERELKAAKAKPEAERYSAVVYCPNCLSVDSVRIVHGQVIGGGGCFRCGALGGQLVEHVNVRQGDYAVEGR